MILTKMKLGLTVLAIMAAPTNTLTNTSTASTASPSRPIPRRSSGCRGLRGEKALRKALNWKWRAYMAVRRDRMRPEPMRPVSDDGSVTV